MVLKYRVLLPWSKLLGTSPQHKWWDILLKVLEHLSLNTFCALPSIFFKNNIKSEGVAAFHQTTLNIILGLYILDEHTWQTL